MYSSGSLQLIFSLDINHSSSNLQIAPPFNNNHSFGSLTEWTAYSYKEKQRAHLESKSRSSKKCSGREASAACSLSGPRPRSASRSGMLWTAYCLCSRSANTFLGPADNSTCTLGRYAFAGMICRNTTPRQPSLTARHPASYVLYYQPPRSSGVTWPAYIALNEKYRTSSISSFRARCALHTNFGRNTFGFSRLHGGDWLLLRAPRMYSSEQAPAYLATLHHMPLPRPLVRRNVEDIIKELRLCRRSLKEAKRFGRLLTSTSWEPMRVIEVSMEQRRNERAGETGDTRENPPTNEIVWARFPHAKIRGRPRRDSNSVRLGGRRAGNENLAETNTEDGEINALAASPQVSSCAIARGSGMSQASVLRILHCHAFHPYHAYLLQEALSHNTPDLSCIFFSDEAIFTHNGQVSLRNTHCWSVNNSQLALSSVTSASMEFKCKTFHCRLGGSCGFSMMVDQHMVQYVCKMYCSLSSPVLSKSVGWTLVGTPRPRSISEGAIRATLNKHTYCLITPTCKECSVSVYILVLANRHTRRRTTHFSCGYAALPYNSPPDEAGLASITSRPHNRVKRVLLYDKHYPGFEKRSFYREQRLVRRKVLTMLGSAGWTRHSASGARKRGLVGGTRGGTAGACTSVLRRASNLASVLGTPPSGDDILACNNAPVQAALLTGMRAWTYTSSVLGGAGCGDAVAREVQGEKVYEASGRQKKTKLYPGEAGPDR
ncbi:hypothetical protein PR048_019353 [Dryococelus australis]|uniref:Uncharacterized protein n=1 Tax=Dryococelus australis TaxID=614101 RepID=A0ABQ9H3C3_9NEOP|nr:hypothetical protein PR048_019353 [Dryococelus australis]